jgi:hypothetical protein
MDPRHVKIESSGEYQEIQINPAIMFFGALCISESFRNSFFAALEGRGTMEANYHGFPFDDPLFHNLQNRLMEPWRQAILRMCLPAVHSAFCSSDDPECFCGKAQGKTVHVQKTIPPSALKD